MISGKHATIGLYDKTSDEDFERPRELMETLSCGHLWTANTDLLPGRKAEAAHRPRADGDPRILILDEPCNGLDIFSRERLLESIAELVRQPNAPTLIYVTHHTEEILPAFSHVLLMRRGEAVGSGKTEDILTAENLSGFFESPVVVDRHGERFYVRVAE